MDTVGINEAFDLLNRCQVVEPGELDEQITDAIAVARQAEDAEAESVLLFAEIVSQVVVGAKHVPDLILAMIGRTVELNQPIWHATSLALSATSGHDTTHVLFRLETLAEAIAILTRNATPSRAMVRGLNAVALAYGVDRMWELSEQFFVQTKQMAEQIDDTVMQTATVINRLYLGANETMDLLRLGYFDQAQQRAREALQIEWETAADPFTRGSSLLVWIPLGLRSLLVHPPNPEFDVGAWQDLGPDRNRVFGLLAGCMAVHNDDLTRAEQMLDLVLAHPMPIEEPLAGRLAVALGARIAQRRIEPALRHDVETHLSALSEETQEVRLALTATAHASIVAKQQEEETAELRRLSAEDSLTGVSNRRAFDTLIDLRRGQQTALLIIDIDDFKAVNDQFGHEVGDEVLRRTGSAIITATRERDAVCRIGGDEFAVVLAAADEALANRIVARVAAEVSSTDWSSIAAGLSINVSIGAATAETSEVYRLADAALYESKAESGHHSHANGDSA